VSYIQANNVSEGAQYPFVRVRVRVDYDNNPRMIGIARCKLRRGRSPGCRAICVGSNRSITAGSHDCGRLKECMSTHRSGS
jgi:hypothetical protein